MSPVARPIFEEGLALFEEVEIAGHDGARFVAFSEIIVSGDLAS